MKPIKTYTFGKKQLPESDVRTRLRAHIMDGKTPKEFSMDENLQATTPGKMLEGMGISKMFVTDEERALLFKMRKERAA